MKQTAVEWFFWKLYVLKEVEYESIMELYEQAKEMEKEQIIDACNIDKRQYDNAEQYYNETFKSE
jgi:hypothetical protein